MKVITKKPMKAFLREVSLSDENNITIVSPFVSSAGSSDIIQFAKSKECSVRLLTNLSPFLSLQSFDDPIKPLLDMKKELGSRLKIRSRNTLHAKLYLAGKSVFLSGSSNLTNGGLLCNEELNFLGVSGENDQQIAVLSTWFNRNWRAATKDLSLKVLKQQQVLWETEHISVRKNLPEPQLGGNYWEKVVSILSYKSIERAKAEKILAENIDKKKNVQRKLLFLKCLGLIDFDKNSVTPCLKKAPDKGQFYKLLADFIPYFTDIRKIIDREPSTYASISKKLGIPVEDKSLHDSVNWLVSLGYIVREKRGSKGDRFSEANP